MKRFALALLVAGALAAADSQIVPSLNAFTAESYKQLATNGGNLILSPFNIATALSMALAGARGQTAAEIQSVLHLAAGANYAAAFGTLLANLAKAGNTGGNQLLAANGLWVQKGFGIEPAFESTLANHYKAPPAQLDFLGNPEGARAQINSWTDEHTKGKIKDLFPAGSLDPQTRLVLASAIYFYGSWQNQFVTSRTRPEPFTLLNGTTVQGSFMNQTTNFLYGETQSAQILEMPYAGTGIAFDVVLPKSAAGLAEIEKSMTATDLAGWVGTLSSRNVEVSLPKFRSESGFSLAKSLAAMGMPTAFSDQADFSGIAPDRTLAISQVFHKAFVDVSEKGTEAAAATGIGLRAAAMRLPPPPVVFRADHPFLFLIRDTRSGAILFIGRLMNPR